MRGAGGGCVTPQRGTHCAPQAAWTHCPSDVSQHPHERGSYPRLQRGKLRHRRLSYTKGPPLCPCIRLSPHQRGAGHPSPASELRKTKARERSVSRWLCPDGVRSPRPPHTRRLPVCKRGTDSPGSTPLCKDHTSPAKATFPPSTPPTPLPRAGSSSPNTQPPPGEAAGCEEASERGRRRSCPSDLANSGPKSREPLPPTVMPASFTPRARRHLLPEAHPDFLSTTASDSEGHTLQESDCYPAHPCVPSRVRAASLCRHPFPTRGQCRPEQPLTGHREAEARPGQ